MVSFLQNHSLWLAALLLVGLTTGLYSGASLRDAREVDRKQ
jgi:hypothetical protein